MVEVDIDPAAEVVVEAVAVVLTRPRKKGLVEEHQCDKNPMVITDQHLKTIESTEAVAETTDIITTWEKMDTSMEVIIIITIIVIIAVAIVRMLEGVVMVIEVEVKGETITHLDETTTLITETEIEVGHARLPWTCQ